VDVSFDWKPVYLHDMGKRGNVEHQSVCSILDHLQGFDGTSGEPSQQQLGGGHSGVVNHGGKVLEWAETYPLHVTWYCTSSLPARMHYKNVQSLRHPALRG
jgi:hypothetical protein